MDSRTQRASGTVVDPRASLAMWLRTGRTQRNLSLEDVARITKIQPRILEKLENGNLEGLPADVFVKGFVRSFAKCVGLDEREALDRLGAAQSGTATTVAQAFVDSMSVRLVQPSALGVDPASSSSSLPVAAPAIDVVEIVDFAPIAPLVVEPVPAAEIVDVAPLAPVAVEAAEPAKKKRAPRKKNPTAAPRTRKKKAVAELVVAAETADVAATTETVESAESSTVETASTDSTEIIAAPAESSSEDGLQVAASDERISAREIAIVQTMSVEAPEPSVDDGVVEPQAFAEGSQPNKSGRIELIDLSADESTESSASGSWQPTMPPLSTSPSVPWRRAQTPQQAAYVVPHMVIDDADPDSADRQREREERANREHSRLSFLPAILLDREDRSARQGGLTLAVIILLIAATLTLSYLMRRPSARGDGVTLLDGSSELLG